MEQSIEPVDSHAQNPLGENLPATVPPPQPPATTFTKVDNNLTGIGFFTASSKRSRKAIEKTTVVVDQGVAHTISILPSAKYGLPITQDQDYWLALMKLVSEKLQREGKLTNPFAFTTAELQHILGQTDAGKNYKAVNEWLSVMNSTAIEGGTYNVVRKSWYTEKTHAVDRVITVGKQLPDGTIADKNFIWFSQWQLDNINSGKLIAVELGTYIQLENNISKNLVPHLQEWLFASQHDGRFEKQYEDICQLLGIRVYHYRSDIERKVGPSLDELVTHGYLSKWAVEPMADHKHYKLVLWHGPKYHTDRQTRLSKKPRTENLTAGEERVLQPRERRPRQRHLNLAPVAEPAAEQPPVIIDYTVVAELEKRGVGNADARAVLKSLPPEQLKIVPDQLEYGDLQVEQSRSKITNPPGFYISLLQRNVPVPAGFETSRAKKARQEAILAHQQALQKQREEALAREEEERQWLESQIAALDPAGRLALLSQAKADLLARHPHMAVFFQAHPDSTVEDGAVRSRMRQLLASGWKPQQAINSPTRQSDPVQETASTQNVADQPQSATTELPPNYPLDLKALLATPKLMAPVEQQAVEPAAAVAQPEAPITQPYGVIKSDPIW